MQLREGRQRARKRYLRQTVGSLRVNQHPIPLAAGLSKIPIDDHCRIWAGGLLVKVEAVVHDAAKGAPVSACAHVETAALRDPFVAAHCSSSKRGEGRGAKCVSKKVKGGAKRQHAKLKKLAAGRIACALPDDGYYCNPPKFLPSGSSRVGLEITSDMAVSQQCGRICKIVALQLFVYSLRAIWQSLSEIVALEVEMRLDPWNGGGGTRAYRAPQALVI